MAYMLTIVLIDLISFGDKAIGDVFLSFIIQFSVGVIFGYLLGKLAVLILNRLNIDNQAFIEGDILLIIRESLN